jgi:glutaredoxin
LKPDRKPEEESPVLFGNGMIAVIAGIVIILAAILVAGMIQAGQDAVVPPAAGSATQIIPQATPAPVNSARPAVDLYVMSFCPYGIQAEQVMSPVVDLLKSKTDIRIRYITTVTGSTVDSVKSLHGIVEAKEDLRQICINKYSPEKYWSYLKTFNEQCYRLRGNATMLSSCRKNTAATLSIDSAKIDTCAEGAEGLALLRADETASAKDAATSSPTLVINGVRYSGARTPEAYKQAICNAFETAPAECSTVLSSASASASTATGRC